LEALASITGSSSLLQEAAEVCHPVSRNGKRYRGLNALAQKDHLQRQQCKDLQDLGSTEPPLLA
jgi:hypothetical protein